MKEYEAFDQTLKKFDVRASELARETGVSERQISQFRHGKSDLNCSTLFILLRALPAEAKEYFAGASLEIKGVPKMSSLSNFQKAEILSEIAEEIRGEQKNGNLRRDMATI